MHYFKTYLIILLALFFSFIGTAFAEKSRVVPPMVPNSYTNIAGEINSFDKIPVLIGGKINISQGMTSDTLVLGGLVNLGGIISQNALVSAGDLTMNGSVGQNALLLGGKMNLTDKNSVGQNTLLIAGDANVAGHYLQNLLIVAGKVKISGRVDGNVRVIAGQIEVMPSARIAGSLHYISSEPVKVDDGAVVSGGVAIWQPFPIQAEKPLEPKPKFFRAHFPGIIFNLGLFVIGLFAALLTPGFCRKSLHKLKASPWLSLLTGFLTLVVVPIAIIILLITVVGIPLAVVTLFSFFVALMVAYVFISLGVGALILKLFCRSKREFDRWHLVLSVFLGLIVLYLLRMIPYLGGWIGFFAFLFGLGMFMLAVFACCKSSDAQAQY